MESNSSSCQERSIKSFRMVTELELFETSELAQWFEGAASISEDTILSQTNN